MSGKQKWDWAKLKLEYLSGDWLNVVDFLKDKGIPLQSRGATTGWSEEKKELQKKALEQSSETILEQDTTDLVQIRSRQANLARFLQLKGAKKLENLDPDTVDEARRLIVSGMQEERRALGLDGGGKQSLTQINIKLPKTNLDKWLEEASYEETIKFLASIRKEKTRRIGTSSSSKKPRKAEEGKAI